MVTSRKFDEFKGVVFSEIILSNKAGMEVSILDYGATIRSVWVPGKSGEKIDVCLGYDTIAEYINNNGHFGCSVGRVANRTAGAAFDLDGVHYTLEANTPPNHLHGGSHGFDKKIWQYDTDNAKNSVRFTCKSADGEAGYPGELTVSAEFTLTEENALVMEYRAQTSRPTPVNLTNHWYFNLNGHDSGDIFGHSMRIDAETTTEMGAGLCPNGNIIPVAGTALDFRTAKTVGQDFEAVRCLETGGYDFNYCIGEPGVMKTFAECVGDKSGIRMTAATNQEGVQFYTGNSITERKGKGGATYTRNSGMCLEAQHYPDAINKPQFPNSVLRPGEEYFHHTEFRFEA